MYGEQYNMRSQLNKVKWVVTLHESYKSSCPDGTYPPKVKDFTNETAVSKNI